MVIIAVLRGYTWAMFKLPKHGMHTDSFASTHTYHNAEIKAGLVGGALTLPASPPCSRSDCLAHQSRSDFCDLRLRCPSRTPEIASDFRDFALGLKGAMENR